MHDSPSSVLFSPFSSREIRSLSVCRVDNPDSFNQLWHPSPGGLYDLRMGPFTDRNELACATCLLRSEHCPGGRRRRDPLLDGVCIVERSVLL